MRFIAWIISLRFIAWLIISLWIIIS